MARRINNNNGNNERRRINGNNSILTERRMLTNNSSRRFEREDDYIDNNDIIDVNDYEEYDDYSNNYDDYDNYNDEYNDFDDDFDDFDDDYDDFDDDYEEDEYSNAVPIVRRDSSSYAPYPSNRRQMMPRRTYNGISDFIDNNELDICIKNKHGSHLRVNPNGIDLHVSRRSIENGMNRLTGGQMQRMRPRKRRRYIEDDFDF